MFKYEGEYDNRKKNMYIYLKKKINYAEDILYTSEGYDGG